MQILITDKSEDYELLDSGNGQKLERYGSVVLSRPDNQAIWPKTLKDTDWQKADAVFTHGESSGRWAKKDGLLDEWQIVLEGLRFNLKLLPSKHLGLFPEQSQNWKWLEEKIKKEIDSDRKVSVLNLFAHTGGATLACSRAGAEVVHLDASKFPVDYAKKNLEDSGLGDKKVRFIVDDVRKFVEREIKRGSKYDIIILDPPVYGKGTNDKVWKIEEDLLPLLSKLKSLLSDNPIAILLNGYASIYSSVSYSQILSSVTTDLEGKVSFGELDIKETSSGKLLPCGIFARWEK
ncbi:MAG: 23S rRNA (cytosine1962-C5)-methyltransferase [Parcubacteria bacterium C7867-003]|nr:MAG: 23S rRNA (cytosine1962-C5)-methyltransferase [Parcubacteria bacterium C7867-003]